MKNRRWLGYELSVLRRIKFNSIAIPFSGQPDLDWYLKFWGKQIFSNDLCQWSWWTSRALVENQQEALGEEEVAQLLHNAYVPRRRLNNPALSQTMGEMDAWWFDNVWLNIQQIENPHQRALAYYHALGVGDYVHSFTSETVELRRPLSEVFEQLWRQQRKVHNNDKDNRISNLEASEFIGIVQRRQRTLIAAPEEIAFNAGWIGADELARQAQLIGKSDYGRSLAALARAEAPSDSR